MGVNPFNPTTGSLTMIDDGTYYNFQMAGTTYFRVRKSDNALQLKGAIEDNSF